MRRGVWLYPGAAAGALVDAIVAAEDLGLDEIWVADEGVAREPTQILAAAAMKTNRIRLAVGITSPLLRHPGAIAATIATLDELSDSRAVLGFGVGGNQSLEPFGLVAERPVLLVKGAIVMARAVLAGKSCGGYEPPDHIIGNARSVNEDFAMALYQSASDVDLRDSVRRWDEVGAVLTEESARLRPEAVGVNLVDLMRSGQDPVALVEHAARVLGEI